MQVFESTASRENSANGRSAARNARNGSKTSPTSTFSITIGLECLHVGRALGVESVVHGAWSLWCTASQPIFCWTIFTERKLVV
jgi:hypothetical protein